MLPQIKNLLYTGIAILLFCFMDSGCKKKDVFPSQQLPQINTLSPSSGKAGIQVTIKGSNLKNVSSVKFGTVDAVNFNPGSNTDTAIQVTVPDSLALGNLYLQVYLADGKGYTSHQFTVLLTPPVPKIDSVSPVSALPGKQVVLSGVNFALVTNVTFGGVKANFSPALDTNHKMQAIVPLTAAPGDQYITLINPNGIDSIPFHVDFYPTINSFLPEKAAEGDVVTLSGVRFTGATSVKLGSLSATYTVISDTIITFMVPTGAVSAPVAVTTSYGTGISSSSLVVSVAGFKLIIYDDQLQPATGFGVWGGWNGTYDLANTSPVESGIHSIKINYVGGYGSPVQWGGANIDLTQYTTFKISIYGGTGTNGNKVKIVFNGANGKELILTEGKWTDYEIPISDITSGKNLAELWIQEFSGVNETIYVDNIGLN